MSSLLLYVSITSNLSDFPCITTILNPFFGRDAISVLHFVSSKSEIRDILVSFLSEKISAAVKL